jgi:type IV secretion system protein VirB9
MKKTMFVINFKKTLVIFLISFFSFFLASNSYSNNSDNRIRTFIYGENDIFVVTSMFGYQTIIELETEEKIQTISIGNPNLFRIVPSGNRIFVKAVVSNQITNMFVITDKRKYQFDLSSYAKEASEIIYVARFLYPEYIENPSAKFQSASGSSPMNLYNNNINVRPRTNYEDFRNSIPSAPSLSKITSNIKPASMPNASVNVSNPYVGKNDPRNNFLVRQSQSNR